MKKWGAWILILTLVLPLTALAEDETTGPRPRTLYVGYAQSGVTLRTEPDREAAALGGYSEGDRVEITGYEPEWLSVVKDTGDGGWVAGYVLRHLVDRVSAVVEDVLPYPCVPSSYVGTIARDTLLYTHPSGEDTLYKFTKGAKVAVISIENGWAKVIYWRQYGYFSAADLADLEPLYDLQSARPGDVLAAYNSFYNMADTELNNNRKYNIQVCCNYISKVLEPGYRFSFNQVGGPYTYARGYMDGIAFVGGEAVPTPGGGTCQVSSTLYNVLLALPEGVAIEHRRAHGPSGATYLPHGADAAVGSEALNLIFRNNFDFPLVLYAYPQDGVLYIEIRKGESLE